VDRAPLGEVVWFCCLSHLGHVRNQSVARAPLGAVGLVLLSLTSRSCKESVSGSCSIGRGMSGSVVSHI